MPDDTPPHEIVITTKRADVSDFPKQGTKVTINLQYEGQIHKKSALENSYPLKKVKLSPFPYRKFGN